MDESFDGSPEIISQKTTSSAKKSITQIVNVYIWDMDETLILLKSLLDGTYALAFDGSKDVQMGIEIGKRWEKHILQVCDEVFFYEQIENYNEPFLDALKEYDDGRDLSDYDFSSDGFGPPCDDPNKRKLAYRHRIIAEKYAQGLHNILDNEMIRLWDDLYELTDAYTDRWLSSARNFLQLLSGEKKASTSGLSAESAPDFADTKCININVLVTSGSLIPSLVKCLLFRLDHLITHENVYCSSEVGKLQCFSWIKERFGGPEVKFCVIGDGPEECEASQIMRWPFIRISLGPDGSHRFPGLTLETFNHAINRTQ